MQLSAFTISRNQKQDKRISLQIVCANHPLKQVFEGQQVPTYSVTEILDTDRCSDHLYLTFILTGNFEKPHTSSKKQFTNKTN